MVAGSITLRRHLPVIKNVLQEGWRVVLGGGGWGRGYRLPQECTNMYVCVKVYYMGVCYQLLSVCMATTTGYIEAKIHLWRGGKGEGEGWWHGSQFLTIPIIVWCAISY